jgi:probable selenium-dependent hydroxylase accessory protein YqeC
VLETFGLRAHRAAWIIGGGGKTSLMFALARALTDVDRTVITSTSTRMRPPRPEDSPRLVLAEDTPDLHGTLRAALEPCPHVTVALARLPREGKLAGLPLATLDALAEAGVATHLLVEADGSAGRSLKAHLDHEPVVSQRPGLVIAVVGVDVLGRTLDDAHVHRSAVLRARLGRGADDRVTAEDVAAAVLGPGGYASRVAPEHAFTVFLAKADGAGAREAARSIATALRTSDTEHRLARIVAGDVHTDTYTRLGS